MPSTSHLDKLEAALRNPKCEPGDVRLLEEARERYQTWKTSLAGLRSKGKKRVAEMTRLLNEYKDFLEVELIARRGSAFLKRQKGQLKLDNSVLEEFLVELVQPAILDGLKDFAVKGRFVHLNDVAHVSLSQSVVSSSTPGLSRQRAKGHRPRAPPVRAHSRVLGHWRQSS